MKKFTQLLALICCTLFSFPSVAQTIYQLDHIHSYTWQDEDWLRNVEEYYEYDIGGIKETDVLNKVSADGISFIDNFRHTKSYNSNNFILGDLKELWNGTNWIDDTRITKTYDPTDYLLQELKEKYNGTSWENDTKTDISFNQSEQTQESLFYDKFEAENWVLFSQTFDVITPTGGETERWIRNFITGLVEKDSKTISTITNYQLITEINQSWNETLMEWGNNEKLEVSYTTDDQWDTFNYYSWDDSAMPADWEPDPYSRTSYIRDDATYDLIILVEDNETGTLVNASRILYTRDGNSNLLTSTVQIWEDDEWLTFLFTSHIYDSNNNNTQSIYQNNYSGTGLENSSRVDRFWSEATALSVSFNSLDSISMYPNPTTDVINVKFKSPTAYSSEAILYDMQGKLIHKVIIKEGSSTTKIPIEYQANGIYMLHINTNKSTQVYKIVKGS